MEFGYPANSKHFCFKFGLIPQLLCVMPQQHALQLSSVKVLNLMNMNSILNQIINLISCYHTSFCLLS